MTNEPHTLALQLVGHSKVIGVGGGFSELKPLLSTANMVVIVHSIGGPAKGPLILGNPQMHLQYCETSPASKTESQVATAEPAKISPNPHESFVEEPRRWQGQELIGMMTTTPICLWYNE